MATGIRLAEKAAKYLRDNPDQKFKAREIAEWIMKEYPKDCEKKRQASRAEKIPLDTDEAMASQLVAELGAQRASLQDTYGIKTTAERPRRYYYTERSDETEVEEMERRNEHGFSANRREQLVTGSSTTGEKNFSEDDLYPKVMQFLHAELNVYGKRIHEGRSSNRRGPGGNRWLHPDLVGMEDLSSDWHRDIRDCVAEAGERKVRLWSVEVKKSIPRSEVRKYFFQAVSNSSWANLGYLVTVNIDEDALSELRILSELHGIGLIRLDPDNPPESEIVLPARERAEVDWATANRIAEENEDFRNYIKLVHRFHQTKGYINPRDWNTPQVEDD